MIEYWTPEEPFEKPENVEWESKAQTGLYEFKKVRFSGFSCVADGLVGVEEVEEGEDREGWRDKGGRRKGGKRGEEKGSSRSLTLPLKTKQTKSTPISLTLSPTGQSFSILSLPSLRLTTFTFLTARLHRAYDESLTATQEMQQAGTLPSGVKLDSMEFGRRLAGERELEKNALECVLEGRPGVGVGRSVWDEGGNFVIYPTLLGIKGAFERFSLFSTCGTSCADPPSLLSRLPLSLPNPIPRSPNTTRHKTQSSTRSPTRSLACSARTRRLGSSI